MRSYNFCSSSDIIRSIKSRIIGWVGLETRMRKMRSSYKISNGRGRLRDLALIGD
jgi:hypothetical protein